MAEHEEGAEVRVESAQVGVGGRGRRGGVDGVGGGGVEGYVDLDGCGCGRGRRGQEVGEEGACAG